MHTLASVRHSYRRVINARYSVVYSSLASSLFSSRKLSNGEAVTRRRATSCLPLVYPHVMYHPRPSTFSQSFPPPHGRTINARNKNGETRNGEGLEPRLALYNNIIHMHRNPSCVCSSSFPIYARSPIDSTSYTKILSTCNNLKRDVHAYVLHVYYRYTLSAYFSASQCDGASIP